jgi:hypothetical protein
MTPTLLWLLLLSVPLVWRISHKIPKTQNSLSTRMLTNSQTKNTLTHTSRKKALTNSKPKKRVASRNKLKQTTTTKSALGQTKKSVQSQWQNPFQFLSDHLILNKCHECHDNSLNVILIRYKVCAHYLHTSFASTHLSRRADWLCLSSHRTSQAPCPFTHSFIHIQSLRFFYVVYKQGDILGFGSCLLKGLMQ